MLLNDKLQEKTYQVAKLQLQMLKIAYYLPEEKQNLTQLQSFKQELMSLNSHLTIIFINWMMICAIHSI